MGRNERLIINKSYNDSSRITPQSFDAIYGEGQIIISNEYGFEGIYILNTAGDIVRIGYKEVTTSGSTADISEDAKLFVKDYIKAQAFITSGETMEFISVLEDALSNLSIAFSAHSEQNAVDFQEINDRLDALSGVTVEVVTDEHIAEIAEGIAMQQIAAVVADADEDYDTLKEIADWIKSHPGDASEMNEEILVISAATEQNTAAIAELTERMDNFSGGTGPVEGLDELSAMTISVADRFEALMSGAPDYFNTIQEIKNYIDEQLAVIARSGDHVFLSRSQYNYLIEHGVVDISGTTIAYNDEFYYCIYEDDTPHVEPGETSYNYNEETGMIDVNGEVSVEDGIIELNGSVDEDGYVTLAENADIQPILDDDGFVNIPSSQVDDDGYVNVPEDWVIS